MRIPKAILFDLDDTLISFDGVCNQAWEKCCSDFIHDHSLCVSTNDLLKELDKSRQWYWADPIRHKTGRENLKMARREVVKSALKNLAITDIEQVYELADNYSSYHDSLICLFPNTIDTLTKLKATGYRLGLITNGSSQGQRVKLDRFGLNSFFEIILIDQEVGFGKPDIRIYEHALKLLKLTAQDAWMVGDNLVWDIQAPKALDIYSVWHDYKKSGLPANTPIIPDKEIQDISELLSDLSLNLHV